MRLQPVVADGVRDAESNLLGAEYSVPAWENPEHPGASKQPRTQRMSARAELRSITSALSDPSLLPKPLLVTALGTHSYAPAL